MKAQTNAFKLNNIDSAAIDKRVKQEYIKRDSILNAMRLKKTADSLARVIAKQQIENYRDSLVKARVEKRIKDSIARVEAKEKLLNDKRIRDSVAFATKKRIDDSILNFKLNTEKLLLEQKRITDSITFEKKRISDSILIARKNYTDSLNKAREIARKNKEALDKYKNSKSYKDSVKNRLAFITDSIKSAKELTKNNIKAERTRVLDSIRTAREAYNDSLMTVRQNYNDSVKNVQNLVRDKLKQERDRITDSISTVRNKRKDSIDAIRAKNEKKNNEIAKEKTKEKQNKALAVQIHEKKKEDWSNDKLLKKKWSLIRRIYQNTVTRYNYYYNAKRKYDESIKSLEKKNAEDFTKIIELSSFNVEKDGASVASNMDSVIKKSSYSTQIHDPRSKWFDNLFFLMGKAYFVKGDLEGAITTFNFVINEYKDKPTKKKSTTLKSKLDEQQSIVTKESKKWYKKLSHKPVRNQAMIWLAKSYMNAEQYADAKNLIYTLEKDKNFPKKAKASLLLTKATIELKEENYDDAINSILTATKEKKIASKDKVRAEFLLGQLYAQKKDYKSSSEHFKKSIAKATSPEMTFFAKLNIAENASKSGVDTRMAIKQLEKIINDKKFVKYKSQALNTLALIQAQTNPSKGIETLLKSINNKENTNTQLKAIAFAELGDIYYDQYQYKKAKFAYDSAAIYGANPPLENLEDIVIRKDVLSNVVNYLDIIHEQDSLLYLSTLSDKEKRNIAKKALEVQKNNEKAKVVETEMQVVALQPVNANQSNWYFYKPNLVQKGSEEFKLKWGNRKLEDNWRRSSSNTFSSGNTEENEETNGISEQATEKEDNKDINSLLAKVPKSPSEKDAAQQKIIDAYYNLGLTYFSQLGDYANSVKSFDSLLTKYPTNSFKQQTYYALILDYEKLNDVQNVNKYKALLNAEFKNSNLNELATNPNYQKEKDSVAIILNSNYEKTYSLYKSSKFEEAISNVKSEKNSSLKLKPKYELVEALCYAGLKNFTACKTELEKIVATYPNSEEEKRAKEILKYIVQTETTSKDSASTKLITNQYESKAQDSLEAKKEFGAISNAEGKGAFNYNPNATHYILVFIKNVDGKTMALKAGISDYNLLRHNVQEYTTGLNMLTTQQAIISIKQFSNAVFAKKYLNEMAKEKLLFSQFKSNDYELAIISSENFLEVLKSSDLLGYFTFYKKNYK